jgi:hypothetical protein
MGKNDLDNHLYDHMWYLKRKKELMLLKWDKILCKK